MKIKLRTSFVNKSPVLQPGCEVSRALFELMNYYPKTGVLKPVELPLLKKAGYDYDIVGDTRALNELSSHGERTVIDGKDAISGKAECPTCNRKYSDMVYF